MRANEKVEMNKSNGLWITLTRSKPVYLQPLWSRGFFCLHQPLSAMFISLIKRFMPLQALQSEEAVSLQHFFLESIQKAVSLPTLPFTIHVQTCQEGIGKTGHRHRCF